MAGKSDGGEPRTVLESLVWQRDQTYEDLAAHFLRLPGSTGGRATISPGLFGRLAKGERVNCAPVTRRVLQEMFGRPLSDLLRPWQQGALTPPSLIGTTPGSSWDALALGPARVAEAARESLEFAAWAAPGQSPAPGLREVAYELGRVAS